MSMDIVAFIEEYFGIQLLAYQKLQLRMLMMEYAKYEGKARPMIEILKEGTKKKIICKNCGAVLSYEMEDVCRCKNSPWDTGHGYIIDCPEVEAFGHITCPQCNYRIDV